MRGPRPLTRLQCRELAWLYLFAELPDLVWFRSTIAENWPHRL
jgi:hypothetical protein